MDYTTFRKAWDASGLPEYYERMGDLHRLGFTFDAHGDMDHYESEALNQWLTDDRSVMDATLEEVEAAKSEIIAAAILRKNVLGHPAAKSEAGIQQGASSPSDAPSC